MGINLLSVLIIDDESFAIANLSNLIASYCPSLQVIGSAQCVAEGTVMINTKKPDVIFLDINMPEQNGFDLLNHLTHIPSVVFVTAHEKYALEAMKVCAVDFLMKPISIAELKKTQIKLLQIHTIKPDIRKNYSQVLRNLSAIMDNPGSIKKITLHGAEGYEIFEIDDIRYLTGEGNYTKFHFATHKEFMISKTLRDYEEMLEPFGFMRIHKSVVVNLAHIKKIIQKDSVDVLMSDGKTIDVARRRISELLDWAKENVNSIS